MKKILVFVIQLVVVNAIAFAQDSELVKLYKELPDKYFMLKEYSDSTLSVFSIENRNYYLSSNYYNSDEDVYEANLFLDSEDFYDNGFRKYVADTTDEESYIDYTYSHYTVKIIEDAGYMYYHYSYEGQEKLLFFVLLNKKSEKYILIIEQDIPGMGVPKRVAYNAYKIKNDYNNLEKIPFELPEFKWENHYSADIVKNINQYLIRDIEMTYITSISSIKGKPCLSFRPDLSELYWSLVQETNFSDRFDGDIYKAYLGAAKILGLESIGDAKLKTVKVEDLILGK
jgi:hypothetical protein